MNEFGATTWETSVGDDISERLDDRNYEDAQKHGFELVHFDLDPSNGEIPIGALFLDVETVEFASGADPSSAYIQCSSTRLRKMMSIS